MMLVAVVLSVNIVPGEVAAQEEEARTEAHNASTIGCLMPLSGRYRLVGEKALKGVMTALKSANSSAEYEIRILPIRVIRRRA